MNQNSIPATEDPLLEGFLCPFCIQDLGDVIRLQAHVQNSHKYFVQPEDTFKGLLDRAKQKIFKNDRVMSCPDSTFNGLSDTPPANLCSNFDKISNSAYLLTSMHVQEAGTSRSHNQYFFECRGHYIDETTVQTNNLIMRLDKLINKGPQEGHGRKDFERETVSWLEDNEVKSCQICFATFHSFSRRRHHCRLCGYIMCNSCSVFLTFFEAQRLINPLYDIGENESLIDDKDDEKESSDNNSNVVPSLRSNLMSVFKSKKLVSVREKSEKLVLSAFSRQKKEVDGNVDKGYGNHKSNDNEKLRLCTNCFSFLDRWKEKIELVITPHPLVPLYEELCGLLREVHKLAPSYLRMAQSLSKGETLYSLELAIQLRQKIDIVHRQIDNLSSKIENLGVNDENLKVTQRELDLQKQIRCLAIQTMQEVVWQLSPLPNEVEFRELQEKRRAEIVQQAELEYKNHASYSSPTLQCLSQMKKEVTPRLVETPLIVEARQDRGDQGWVPGFNARLNPFDEDTNQIDPLEEQMFNIKGFLNQAIRDGRLEEVHILEKNLLDLQNELDRRKTASSLES